MSGADGYSVIVGDPTSVTNNGDNTFTVSTTADCTIKINFEAIPQYTVTWNNHGLTSTSQVYEGEKPVFPETPTSCDATSTTFIGWATENWTGRLADLAGKTVYTSAAEMPAVTGPVEYFAVYAKVAGESGWIETAIGDLGASDVFVFSDGSYALNNDGGTSDAPTANAITVSDGKITSDVANNLKWNISGNATDGYTFYPNGSAATWLYCNTTKASSSNNNMRVGTGDRKVFEINASGYLVTKDTYTARYLSRYDDSGTPQDFRGYTSTGSAISPKFYKYSAGSASDYMTTCAAEGTCEAPSFSPAAGTFDGAQDITLQTSTPSAHIYYTLDGTDPDNGSAEYSTPIHITQNTTIKAITYADGLTKSSISTGVFNIRCAQPTFSLAAGEYTTAQNVTISAAGADAVYYTINGDDPSVDPANLYDGSAIAINTTGSHTIKAIAVKAGYANSNVASATYVMDLPYGSIAEFVTAKPNTAKDLVFEEADNCVITGINGNSVYVQDASGKGMIIFNKSGYGALEFHVGDRIVGTVNGKYQAFNGQHEMSLAVFAEGVTFTAVSRPTPVPVTAIDETAFNANTQILVKIEDLYYKSSSDKTHKFATTEGGSTEYTIYDQFGIMSGKTMPETSVACNLTGILSIYNTTYQLLPVFATDIVADADADAPVFTPAGGATEGEAVQVDLNSYVSIAPADANHSVDITSAQITTTEPVSVTAVSSRDFYRNTSVTKWYYGNSASASYDINGQGSTPQGTIVAKVNDEIAASAKEYLYKKEVGGYRINTNFHEEKYDMGRMFGFAYGEKENGAVFSHMTVMYANALYQNGMVREGYEALQTLADTSLDFDTSYMYPGIPEYFNASGRGMYSYLTGAASWYMLTVVTEAFGVKGENGNLVLEPKLVKEQFDENGEAAVELIFADRQLTIKYVGAKGKDFGQYKIASAVIDGADALEVTDTKVEIARARLESLDDSAHEIVVKLN